MLKRLISGLLVLGLMVGLGGLNLASATEPGANCGGCPPPPPPPPPCGLQELVFQTQIWVGDCSPCYDVRARLLEDCSPCAAVIDAVQFDWCDTCTCDCDSCGFPWPAVGLNGVLWIEDFVVENGVATVTLRAIADPAVFGGIFGDFPRGIEVIVNGVSNVTCAVLDCNLVEGGPLTIDWGWFFGGDVKVKAKASAKASVKASSSGKYSAKASAKSSISIKAGSFKYSAKASAKSSVKVSSGGTKVSAKASAKVSVKSKGAFAPPPWALAIAKSYAGVGPSFGGAYAKAWAGWLWGPGAVAIAHVGGGPRLPPRVNVFGGAHFGGGSAFIVLAMFGCDCNTCDNPCDTCGGCGDCDCPPPPCQGPNCDGPCGPCDGKVTSLTLLNRGPQGNIRVDGKDGVLFEAMVAANTNFTVAAPAGGTLGTNIYVLRGGVQIASIHTSCSKPIGVGMVFGDLTVVAGASLKGGPLCSAAGLTQDSKTSKKK